MPPQGWRLDYFLASAALMPQPTSATASVEATDSANKFPQTVFTDGGDGSCGVVTKMQTPWRAYDSWILQDVYGSDHLPLGLTLVYEDECQRP